ncbi:MAG: hexosaminidase [Paraglaciecola sp.]|jgi:hexosaminidase
MNKYFLFLLLVTSFFLGCNLENPYTPTKENQYNIIPLPASLTPQKGQFIVNEKTIIVTDKTNKKAANIAIDFSEKIKAVSGYDLSTTTKVSEKNAIIFILDSNLKEEEGYTLSVNINRVLAKAKTPKGLFYAYQTLRQLLPNELEKGQLNTAITWSIPAVEITDSPRLVYRGGHFDVSRHFFEVAAVKMYIDQLAYHKMNYFHWRLTDDQSWRIEIKQYPKLTEIGGFREATLVGHYNDQPHQFDGKQYGGFYTQEDVREIIKYAADRFITVVPEIEMPGHVVTNS